MGVFFKAVLDTRLCDRATCVLGPARLMTALDMKGVSVSVLPIDEALTAALKSKCGAPAWPEVRDIRPVEIVSLARPQITHTTAASDDPQTRATVKVVCEALLRHETELNALDAQIGDGDTGTTFASAARAILESLDALPLKDPAQLCAALGKCLSEAMGGTSGVLLSILAAATGRALSAGAPLPGALRAGVEQMTFYGGAKVGDRTMLDALSPAVAALERGEDCEVAASAARMGANATAHMVKAHAGRSSYLGARDLTGVLDPGAVAIAVAFEAAAVSPRVALANGGDR